MAMQIAPPIEVLNLKTGYDDASVLSAVSLRLNAGEVLGLVGLNGAGKTTLIKSILGLLPPQSGSVLLWGQPASIAKSRQKLAFLPEKFEPAAFMTGREYCHFAVRLYGNQTDNKTIDETAERLDLDVKALGTLIKQYSKGMRQKIGLMSCLLNDAQLLILDEPMSGLDPLARQRWREEIKRCKDEGRTVLMSSHDLQDVERICDRIAIIHGGTLLLDATPSDLKQQTHIEDIEAAYLNLIAA